jgi:AraC-like DNA-binding protein
MEVLYMLKRKDPGYQFQTQCYERFQVILVLQNELRIESRGTAGRLNAGDIALLRNGSAFALSCPEEGYEGVGVELLRTEHDVFHGQAWWGHAGVVSLALGHELKRQMEATQITSNEYFRHLAISFAWNAAMTDRPDRPESCSPGVWTERMKQQINQTLGVSASLESCFSALGLSYRQLSRHFTNTTGMSPKQYQFDQRIEMAKRYLTDTSWSITTIAMELGFSSSQYFSSSFRKAVSCCPLHYRREHQDVPPCPKIAKSLSNL